MSPGQVAGKVVPAALVTAGIAWEVYALDDTTPGDTWSQNTRDLFHTNTPAGRAVWFCAWGSLAAWFAWHIGKGGTPVPGN